MKRFKVVYIMYPEPNIEMVVTAHSEEEAVIFAKNYMDESFSIEEVTE